MGTIQQYFAAMPRSFQAKKANKLNLTYQFQIVGSEESSWGVSIVKGQCKISSGPPPVADVVLTMNSDTYLKLAAGQLNVVAAYQAGQIRVNGFPQLALDLIQLFSPWASHVGQIPTIPQPTQPTPQPTQPTPQPTQPTPQPAQPTPQPTQPTPQPTQPTPQPTQPTPQPTQPTLQPTQPTPQPTQPIPQPTQPTLADYVQAMPFGLKADQVSGMNVAYQFQLSGTEGGTWTVRVANGSASVATGGGAANVVIGISGADFIRLAQGHLNTVQAYQQGQLQVSGDLNLAAGLTTVFAPWASQVGQVPTTPQPTQPTPQPTKPTPQPTQPTPQPLDPTPQPTPSTPSQPAPQPSQPTSNIAKYVMAMPNGFKPGEAQDLWVIYEFQISGDGGGTWSVMVANQKCTVSEGRIADSPTMELGISGEAFIKLAQGQLNTKQAFQFGQLQIAGELDYALKLTKIFKPWANTINSLPPLAPAPPPPAAPVQVSTSVGLVYPGLANGSFDEYQNYIRDGQPSFWKEPRFPERYGKYWTLQVISEAKGQARLTDSGVFGKFTQKYFRGGGRDYHIHGRHSQVITGRYGFDLVLYQTVAAQSGRDYTFSGSIVSFYKGTAGARSDGKIFKTLGIDPMGGTDYSSPQVVWGGRDGKDNEWRYPSFKTKAKNDAITVFIRLENVELDVGKTELNIIHLDTFKLE